MAVHRTGINNKLDFRYIPVNIDSLNTNELQAVSKAGNNVTLSQSGGTFSVADVDSVIGNEGIATFTTTGTGAATWNAGTQTLNIPTPPTAKRIEQYSGTTNASGAYTVTFPVAFSAAPVVQPSIPNQSATNVFFRVTSVSTTGFTVNVFQRSSVNLLGIDVLLSSTTNVASTNIDVSIFEK